MNRCIIHCKHLTKSTCTSPIRWVHVSSQRKILNQTTIGYISFMNSVQKHCVNTCTPPRPTGGSSITTDINNVRNNNNSPPQIITTTHPHYHYKHNTKSIQNNITERKHNTKIKRRPNPRWLNQSTTFAFLITHQLPRTFL